MRLFQPLYDRDQTGFIIIFVNVLTKMIDTSYIVTMAIVVAVLAMAMVIVILARTTRKVVDKNTALSQRLLEKEDAGASIASPSMVDEIKQELSSMEKPWEMNDTQLMVWMDAKMEELALYQQPDIDLKTVSEALGISQRQILRLLKSQPQYSTFSNYLTEKRLAKACSLLRNHPEYTIEAICLDAGFRTRRTFQTIFKTRLGISPSEYRIAVQNENKTNQ